MMIDPNDRCKPVNFDHGNIPSWSDLYPDYDERMSHIREWVLIDMAIFDSYPGMMPTTTP